MLAPGTLIDGRYEVGPLVGRGGMADVLRADDVVSGEAVAVKVLRLDDHRSRVRFRHETEVLRMLDHPAVVRLRDAGWHQASPFLVLDLVEGPTLAELLADGALGVDRAVATGGRLAAALAHAHDHEVVHRDVKPSNVLFAEGDTAHPRLADFGIARLADATRLTAAGSCVGTAAYLAPEQLEGRSGPAADVYSLGLLVLECITGMLCYPGSVAEAAMARLHRAPVVPPELPSWLRHTLRAMTDRRPDRRPSAAQVSRALGERSVGPLLPAPVVPHHLTFTDLPLDPGPSNAAAALGQVSRPRPASRRAAVPVVAVVAAAVALSAAVVLLGGGGSGPATTPDTTVAPLQAAPPSTPVPPPGGG